MRIGLFDRRALRGAVALLVACATLAIVPGSADAATIVTVTFSNPAELGTFTVPPGVGSITVTMAGGQGGVGGFDSQGGLRRGGYRGVVSGTMAVTPGQQITVAVGAGGGTGQSSAGNASGGYAGQNLLDGYDGASGGRAGPAGSSGGGGGSGAATVVRLNGIDIVAGGAGGNGGNGQFAAIEGRRAEESHLARPDVVSTAGRPGIDTITACSPGFRCDGGASGAGGGGAQGGEQGAVQFGGDAATEYFGLGGYPGANDTAAFVELTAGYEFYAGNSENGSVVISYDTGAPGAPSSVTGVPRSGAVELSWSAPNASGSSAITDYVVEYSTSAGGPYLTFVDGTSTDLTTTVTGLANGTTYYFRVAAVNDNGAGPTSPAMTIGVMPSDVPAAPVINALVPFDSGIYVDFTPGATHNPISGYEYRLDSGQWLGAPATGNRLTIAGLTNGQNYSVEIRALNFIGASEASAPASAMPRAKPGAPSALTAVAANGTVALTWTAPASNNGAAVTDYVVEVATAVGGPYVAFADGTSTATETTVTSLTNATTYYFRVAAVNAVDVGAYSAPAGATPFTVPAAPTLDSVAPGDGSLTVDFTAPSDGGSDITRFEYRLGVSGSWQSTGSLAGQFVIGALTNGTSYSVSLRAVNAAGIGAESSPMSGAPRAVPSAPAIAAVALDTGAVSVTFTTGADGGSPITNFEYSIDGGDHWITRSPVSVASPLTIAGLVGGQTYAVVLRAVNAAGVSGASNESMVTAKGTPDAPIVSGLVASDRGFTVSFTAPPNGGTPITNYEYSLDGGTNWIARSPASASAPLVVSGLVNGTPYDVQLRAVNAVGSGAASTTIVGIPRTTPGAPTIAGDTIVGSGGVLDVVFTAPASDGGSAIIDYEYSTDAGATWLRRITGTTASPLRITALSSDGTTSLTAGATYPVEIRALNAAGPGVASAVASGIIPAAPDAPVITGSTAYDSSAAIRFTTPANGGAAITRFDYRLNSGVWITTGTLANEFVIGGLTNSATYSVEVRAVNSAGDGPASAPRSVSVRTTPGAPTIDSVTSGDHTLSVVFNAGPDGGATISTYQYSTDGGTTWRTRSDAATGSALLITNTSGAGATQLANGTVYPVQIRAVNVAGAGDASTTQLAAPRGAPDAPTDVALSPGDGRLTVTFTPGSDGGSSITGIDYRIGTGAWTDTGSLNSPFTIAGLTNGTSYDVAVRARNAIGDGQPSATATATPRTVPGAPTLVTASMADSSALVSWAAPASNGGAAITAYVVNLYASPSDGSPVASCTSTSALGCTAASLTNGTTYYASVAATNAVGAGAFSNPRVAVTPLAPPRVAIAALNPGANEIAVDVNVLDTGGAPIITFEYRLNGGAWLSASTATEPFTIGGLTQGTTYSVQVRAVNVAGTGDASAPASATPRTKPSAPLSLVATRGNARVVLTWDAPVASGGQPVIDYVVEYSTVGSGSFTPFADGTSTATTATVTGLLNGTAYVFRVAAETVAGTGTPSALAAATPLAAPAAPTINSIGFGSQYLQVSFSAPASNGGSPVTAYEYQLDGGLWRTHATTSSPMTITGLTNGHTYQVALRAVNAVGPGVASNTLTAKPYGVPSVVAGFIARPGSGSATLSWDAADDNGSAITDYNIVRWSAPAEGGIAANYHTTNTSYTVPGLSNGTTYYFTIEAINAAGPGPRSQPRTSVRAGGTAPAAPAIDAVVVTADEVSMAWTAGAAGDAAISGYIVQYSTNDLTFVTVAMHSPAATSMTVAIPSVDAPYSLRVANISAVGAGAFATVRPPLAATGQVAAVGSDSATIDATIHANTSLVTTDFELATALGDLGTGATLVAATPSSVSGPTAISTSAALASLEPGTTYYVRARATSANAMTRGVTRTFTTQAAVESADLNLVYSGAPAPIVTITEPAGLIVAHTYEGIGTTTYPLTTTPPSDAGTYRVITLVVDSVITGSDVATLTIAPKSITVAVTASNKTYDATTDASLTLALVGVVDGDDVTIDAGKVTGAFASVDAITDQVVTIDAEPGFLRGADVANYTVSMPNDVRASIERATPGDNADGVTVSPVDPLEVTTGTTAPATSLRPGPVSTIAPVAGEGFSPVTSTTRPTAAARVESDGQVRSSDRPDSTISAAAQANERNDNLDPVPFALALLAAGIFFYILAKRPWWRKNRVE